MDDINKVLVFCGSIITMLSGAVGVLWRAYHKNVTDNNKQDLKTIKILSKLSPLVKEANELIKSHKK